MENDSPIPISELALTAVNPDSPIPLYFQIEQDLRRLITSGQLPPQATLPPELELCRAYGVGRHTIRMALSRLVADNLIARRAGRGTRVKPQTGRIEFFLDRSFTRQMADMGRPAHSEVLEFTSAVIDETGPAVWRSKIGAPCLRLVRLRFGDNEPIGLQSSTILSELCPGLEKYDFNQNSLYDILATKYKLIIAQIHHTISATVADKRQAELLQVAKSDPLLIVNTTAYTHDQQVVEYTTSYYRADRYEYSTTHTFSPR